MSCHSNLHWFFMHWHSKNFVLLYQFCCIFILKFLLDALHSHLWCSLLDICLSSAIWSISIENYFSTLWVKCLSLKFFKSFVLSDFSFVFVLHFTGKPNLTNLPKSCKKAQIVYEISHNSNVLSWKHNTLEKLQLWLSLADDHF
jgi:hypothetical protein